MNRFGYPADYIPSIFRRLDGERTAVRCYEIYKSRQTNPHNFAPYKAMKGNTWEYNDYIQKLSNKVNDAYRKKQNDGNRHLWEDFDSTRERIDVARAGDHGPYLIAAAQKNLGGINSIYVQSLGNHPAEPEVHWTTVNWAETADRARAIGVDDVHGRIRDFLNGFYREDSDAARQHLQVFRSYKRVHDRTVSCRRH